MIIAYPVDSTTGKVWEAQLHTSVPSCRVLVTPVLQILEGVGKVERLNKVREFRVKQS